MANAANADCPSTCWPWSPRIVCKHGLPFNMSALITSDCVQTWPAINMSALVTSDCVQVWPALQHGGPNHLGLCANMACPSPWWP